MRLGMGFNSYTHETCVEDTVTFGKYDPGNYSLKESPNSFTYSSRVITRLSDIAAAMNVSHRNTMNKGFIEIIGNGTSIDEDKIRAADVNVVASFQVMNQTLVTVPTGTFSGIDRFDPASADFNEAFGDCYISGFVEGGSFLGIISIRCLEGSDKESAIQAIGENVHTKFDPDDLDKTFRPASKRFSESSALRNTDITFSVCWTGGGNAVGIDRPWDIHAVYKEAAAFPALAAKYPRQNTWAILTKYNASRSFNDRVRLCKAPDREFLNYDPVIRYTATLFDDIMKYKHLVGKVQNMICNGDQHTSLSEPNSIPVQTGTLLAVRTALRKEMDKIVAVVNDLAKTLEILSQVDSSSNSSMDKLVQRIIKEAVSPSPSFDDILSLHGPERTPTNSQSPSDQSSTTDFQEVHTPVTSDLAFVSPDENHIEEGGKDPWVRSFEAKMHCLIAPEVWETFLPVRKQSAPICNQAANDLKILAAVCGIHGVTSTLQALVVDEQLTIRIDAIKGLVSDKIYERELPVLGWNLSFIYQYGCGPMHICSINHDKKSSASVHVDRTSSHPTVKPRPSFGGGFPLIDVVYGGMICNSKKQLKKVEEHLVEQCDNNHPHAQCVVFDDDLMGENAWYGVERTGVIFFVNGRDSGIHAAVGLERRCCQLTEQPQLAIFHREITNRLVDSKEKRKPTETGLSKPVSLESGLPAPRYSCTFTFDEFKVQPHTQPFLAFDNGINFVCQRDGLWTLYAVYRGPTWAHNDGGSPLKLWPSGSLYLLKRDGTGFWLPKGTRTNGIRLVFSNPKPFIEIYGKDDKKIWDSDLMQDEDEC